MRDDRLIQIFVEKPGKSSVRRAIPVQWASAILKPLHAGHYVPESLIVPGSFELYRCLIGEWNFEYASFRILSRTETSSGDDLVGPAFGKAASDIQLVLIEAKRKRSTIGFGS